MSQSLIGEYISKRMSAIDLENELKRLIAEYNKIKDSYLLIYASDMEKSFLLQGNILSLSMGDYQNIHEILRLVDSEKLDFYLETPGGSGEAAEELVTFLHSKFNSVDFIIAGEAKSAGTLMAMSADEIYMTDSGSLGPIDAQVKIGRTVVSAFDYVQWMDARRTDATKGIPINPVDAIMIAQITPGEFEGVFHAQQFAVDKLKEWLPKYKFKHWEKTQTHNNPVTDEMKAERAEDIAKKMIDHSTWRSHGKSLKIKDLEEIGLRIKRCEDEPDLCNIIYRIKTVIRLLFGSTTHYKMFITAEESLFRDAIPSGQTPNGQQKIETPIAELSIQCPKCGKQNPLYAKFGPVPKVLEDKLKQKGEKFPLSNKKVCSCGFSIDLIGVRNQLENQLGKKIVE